MKVFFAIMFLGLLALSTFSADLQEETRFLNAVRSAYSTTNIDAITALHCWDGVTDRASTVLAHQKQLEQKRVKSVEYIPPVVDSLTNNGVIYLPNLKPVKWISIEFKPDASSNVPLLLPVGEKNGKLMIIHFIPQKL